MKRLWISILIIGLSIGGCGGPSLQELENAATGVELYESFDMIKQAYRKGEAVEVIDNRPPARRDQDRMLAGLRAAAAASGADGVVITEQGSETVFWMEHPMQGARETSRGTTSLRTNLYRNIGFVEGVTIFYE